MIRQPIIRLALGLALLASLFAGPLTTGAQGPTDLTESFTWDAQHASVRFPAGWTAEAAGDVVSIHPAGRDISDGQGPEVVLFGLPGTTPNTLDATAAAYADTISGTVSVITAGTLDGHATRGFTFQQASPATMGGVTLIAPAGRDALGVAYVVRQAEADAYLPQLEAISASVRVTGDVTDQATTDRALQAYQDAAYGYALTYPVTWVADAGAPGEVTLRPANADPNAGNGPEFVVLIIEDAPTSDIDTMVDMLITGRSGTFAPAQAGTVNGYATRLVTYTDRERTPAQDGAVFVVQIGADTFLAMGYRALADEFAAYRPVFEAIRASLHFPGAGDAPQTITVSSESVASVQLAQRFPWSPAGVVFYLPDGWEIELGQDAGDDTFTATAPIDLSSPTVDVRLLQGSTFDLRPGTDLIALAEELARGYADVGTATALTVAGYPAVMIDMIDDSEAPRLHLRSFVVDLQQGNTGLLLVFGAEADRWEAFRPLADAVIASSERLDDDLVRYFAPHNHPIRADAYWIGPHARQGTGQTDEPEQEPFEWEAYGLSAMLPTGWRAIQGGQDFDLAFISPEAQSGSGGAYITLRYIPMLGPGVTPEAALESVAEQIGSDLETMAVAGQEAPAVRFTDESDLGHHLILIPYGTVGETFYLQSSFPEGQADAVQTVLDTLSFDPPAPDYDAINAAWQASFAEDGRLIYGDAEAPVQMLEFLEMGCPHCSTYVLDVSRLMALEVASGNLQIETAIMVFGSNEGTSGLATEAIYCATEQGKGYTAFETLFASYRSQGGQAYTREAIQSTLGSDEVGVDVDALSACLDEGTYQERIAATNMRASDLAVTGTPGVLFAPGDGEFQFLEVPGGQTWTGGVPLEIVQVVIGQVQAGVDLSELFAETLPAAPEEEADDATSRTVPSTNEARDMPVSMALQVTEEAGDAVVEPAATERVAAEEQSEGDESDASGTSMALVAGGVLLVALIAVGFVLISRRQVPPPSPPAPPRAGSADDDTLDVSHDDTL